MERLLLKVAVISQKDGTKKEYAADLVYDVVLQTRRDNSTVTYKMVLTDKSVRLDEPYTAVRDFVLRTLHRYDGVCPILAPYGQPIGIEGEDQLLTQWEEIRASLLADYNVPFVDEQLPMLDKSMVWQHPMSDYCCFALIFPCIPPNTSIGWQAQRAVRLSYMHNKTFTELLTCTQATSNQRIFAVKAVDEDHTMEKIEGTIHIAPNNFMPSWAYVDIAYKKDDVAYNWTFTLRRITMDQEEE